jgi:hypothetical protein
MNKLPHTLKELITPEEDELIIGMYNQQPYYLKNELEVFAKICEILYKDGCRAYLHGMVQLETANFMSWDRLVLFKTVVDFQIERSWQRPLLPPF